MGCGPVGVEGGGRGVKGRGRRGVEGVEGCGVVGDGVTVETGTEGGVAEGFVVGGHGGE